MKSVANEVNKKHEGVQISKKEEEDLHKEMLPAPVEKHPPLSPDKKSLLSEKIECSEKAQLKTTEHTPADGTPQSESDHQVHQSITSDPRTQQMTPSRSGSVSSTGTYNVESPKKSKDYSNSEKDVDRSVTNRKPKRVDSEGSSSGSSTGTYNVESPKMSRISGISNADAPKIIKNKNPKRADSGSSSVSNSSGRSSKHEASPSTPHKKLVHSRSPAHTMEVPEEKPGTSHMATALPLQPPLQMVIHSNMSYYVYFSIFFLEK